MAQQKISSVGELETIQKRSFLRFLLEGIRRLFRARETGIAFVVIAMIVMFLFSPRISSFIHKHPTLKMLALSFLVMIGLSLIIEGWDSEKAEDLHLKNYIYFGMAFSFIVEMLNMTMRSRAARKNARVVHLNEPVITEEAPNESDLAK